MNKLSIIVPVYNDEKNIENSINSLLKQTTQVDIIVVDDGSTDSTSDILNELKNKYKNIYYFKKENKGISEARNFGVDKVNTEYFGFLDSDDTCKEDMVEKMLNEIEKTNSDICFSNFTWVYPNGKRKLSIDTDYNTKKEILIKMFATLWNKIYKTSWYRNTNIMFPNGLQYEDASVLYRLAPYMDKICFVNESFVNYSQRNKSITHTFDAKVNDMIMVFEGIIKYYKDNKLYNTYKDEIEYVTTRFFLGNSFLRVSKIRDHNERKKSLDLGWKFLNDKFPSFKHNKYLASPNIKNIYYRVITERTYYAFSSIYNLIKR